MSLDPKVKQSLTKVNYQAYLERGQQKLKNGDCVGAIKDYEKSLSLKPAFHSYLGLGVALYKSGKYKNARNALSSSLLYKKSWIAYHYLGWIDFFVKDYKSSGKHFANAVSLHKDAESYYGFALSCFEMKHHAEGIKYFKKSLEVEDRSSRRRQLIEILMRLCLYQDALDIADKSADSCSDYSLLLNKGICLYNLNEFENAKQCLIKSISLQPKAESLKWLSSCCTKMQQYHEAIDTLHRSIALEENYDNCIELGAAYLRINDNVNGEKYFTRAIQYKPTSNAFKCLAIALRVQGKRKQSLEASKEYLSRSHAIAPIDTFLGQKK
jgi:tetratricopeptide (TPR) repeat protein